MNEYTNGAQEDLDVMAKGELPWETTPSKIEGVMTVREVIEMLQNVPEVLQDVALEMFNGTHPRTYVRKDVSQLNVQHGRVQVLVTTD
ncbi:hypothetical protein [Streptomyces sp. CoH17]|uniref:hypothetical protein n=1 Tax=Streptomyces sp. CoH17 TaxID=2992806 RepID=UPI00226F83F8|nr:hypothetical protein [Streptomyces sp. CoH17]